VTAEGNDGERAGASPSQPLRVVNMMLGRGQGGIETAFLDYCRAIRMAGLEVTAVVSTGAAIRQQLDALGIGAIDLRQWGEWDVLAVRVLRRVLRGVDPGIVVVHGRRATGLARRGAAGMPIVGVAHNYAVDHLVGLRAVFTVTDDLRREVVRRGQPPETVTTIPNMIFDAPYVEPRPRAADGAPTVIGTLGRFVRKKGFTTFIEALALLRASGPPFRAIIAGGGALEGELHGLVRARGLESCVKFPGWVDDKAAFFSQLDIFCVPSHHEPFGIVVLEGFAHGVPTVVTDSEGPREVATSGVDALVVPKEDPAALAEGLCSLIERPDMARQLALAALDTVRSRFDAAVVAPMLSARLQLIASSFSVPR
jgi:glycosyltransferase involved in cell wall biosynthesis